ELRGLIPMLEIACHRCDRRGRLSVEKMIEQHGDDMALPDLWIPLAGDCPKARSAATHDRCAIYYPQLPGLFLPSDVFVPQRCLNSARACATLGGDDASPTLT